jgi:hypothetical protein
LKGSGIGHALLNLMPLRAFAGPAQPGSRWRPGIAQLKFRIASSGFGALAAAVVEIAAVQHDWRDIRIA